MVEGTYQAQRFAVGQRVRYRVRRLAINRPAPSRLGQHGRRGRPPSVGEHIEIGEGVVRAADLRPPCTTYDVEHVDGSLVRFDGIGVYEHELEALEVAHG
jgi:hypothetical protein